MRYVCLAVLAVLGALAPSAAYGQYSITNYQYVSEQRVSLTSSNVTYRADLVNTDGPQASVTATLTSLNPSSFTVVPGQNTLTFAPVPSNSQTTSSNTFTILVNRTVAFDPTFSQLQWTFQSTAQPPPVANAGPNQSVRAGTTVTLNGSASTNPSGIGTLTYSWAFTSKPTGSAASISNPTSVMPTFVPDVAGTYMIALTVSNGVASSTASVMVNASAQPVPPVANAGPNQTVNVGATVVLNGSGSTSGSGNPLTYAFTLTGRPSGSNATLTNPNSVSPSFVADKAGTYTAQLVVNDGLANSAPSTVTITTQIVKPVANAGPNQTATINTPVQLTGAASTDANGLPLTYQWSLITFPAGSAATLSSTTAVNPTFTPDRQGTYVAQLIVNNGTLSSDASTVTITTNSILAPTANAGTNQMVAGGGTVVTLHGSGTDPQNLPLTYQWTLITKPTGSAAILSSSVIPNPTFTADLAGTYVAQLVVNNGFQNSAPSTVTINTTCSQPTANPGPNQNVIVGATVTLSGSGSGDACRDPLTYSWTLTTRPAGSNATLTGANTVSPTFVADVVGTFVAQLIVNNGFTPSNPVTVTINVATTPTLTLTPNPLAFNINASGSLTLTLSTPAGAGGQVVNLSSSNTSVATVSATVSVAAGSATVTIPVTPVSVGSTTITASASGFTTGTATVTVNPQPSIAVGAASVNLGQTVNLQITLSAPAPAGGVSVTVASGDTTKVTVSPATVTIAAGATTPATPPVLTGVGIGSATITASATGFTSGSGTATVGAPTMNFTGSPLAITAGSTGTLTLTLTGGQAPAGGLTVNLNSSDTTKATVPATVNFAAGATTATVTVTGVAGGSSTITASATGIASATATVNVAALIITVPGTTTVNLGQSASFAVTLSQAAPAGGVTVTLATSDATKVTFSPATVTIAAGATTPATQPQVTGAGIGSATITASATGYTSGTGTVTVSAPTLGFTGSPLAITAGSTGTLTLTLTGGQAPAGGLTVNLNSSDTTKATVPATVNFAAGATTATVTVTGVAGGSSTITASATGIASATATVNVASIVITVPGTTTLNLGQSAAFAVTLSQAAPTGGVTINLASSDATKVTVSPATVTIAAGATTPATQPQVTGAGIGSTTITASATGYTSGTGTVTVTPPTINFTGSPLSIVAGANGTLTLNLVGGVAPAGGFVVNLSSSDTTKATVPATATIAAGATSATVTVNGIATGTASITASATGVASTAATVNVVSLVVNVPGTTTLGLGLSAPFAVSLSQPAPSGGLTVTLASGDATKVTISPATVVILQGATTPATQPQVTGAGIGSTTITASAPGYTAGTGTVAVTAPTLAFTGSPLGINAGSTGNLTLTLTGGQAPASGLTVTLASSATGIATVPATVNFAAGSTSATVTVTGVAAGSALITASATGIAPATATVNVRNGVLISLPAMTSVGLGQSTTLAVTLSAAAPAGGVTVNLASSDTTKVTVSPASVVIAAGAMAPTTQPTVTAVGIGSATITASSTGFVSATGTVTVPPPTLSFADAPLALNAGTQGTLTLKLTGGQAPTGGLTINLSSSNTAAVTVPATVTFSAGMATAVITPINGVSTGSAIITASAANIASATASVSVSSAVSSLIMPIVVPSASVGQNLQTSITLSLVSLTSCSTPSITCAAKGPGGVLVIVDMTTQQPVLSPVQAPTGGLIVSVTSSDPTKLLIAGSANCPGPPAACGAQQVKFTIPQTLSSASGVYLQGLVSSGTVTITASALGFPSGQATVTLTPSGFQLTGPGGTSSFTTNAGAGNTALTVSSVRLDSSFNVVEPQAVRAGYNNPINGPFDDANGTVSGFPFANLSGQFSPTVNINSSTPAVGTVVSPAVFAGGDTSDLAQFQPVASGSTSLTEVTPTGFSTPTTGTSITAIVSQPGITCAPVTVGQNLETTTSCNLQGTPPASGLPVTITSSDPTKFLLSAIPANGSACTDAGSSTITIATRQASLTGGNVIIPSFCVYGVGSSGSATFTVGLSGFSTGTGTVNLGKSGFVIAGPGGIGAASFTPFQSATTITVTSALLDSSSNFVSAQQLAIGQSVSVNVSSSNTTVGTLSPTTLSFTGGMSSNTTTFNRGSSGTTVLSVATPSGFSTPAQDTSVTAMVASQSFSLSCDSGNGTVIGQNLETNCTVSIGQAAPAGGVPVTLTSNNTASLVLSTTATAAGVNSIIVTIPQGGTTATASFIAQALVGTGSATYTASSSGFVTKTGTIGFAPSGVIIAGPFGLGAPFFLASVSGGQQPVTVYTGVLNTDPNSCGGAAATPCFQGSLQSLRGGIPALQVTLNSSSTAAGTIASPVTIAAGSGSANSQFTPVASGSTTVSVVTPSGFTTSKNDTSLSVNVTP